MTLQEAISILSIVIPIFVHNQTTDAEILAFLSALLTASEGGSGTLPPITVGNQLITISYAPKH